MSKEITEVEPIKSIEIELKQLNIFFKDLNRLYDEIGDEYWNDFKELRDKTDRLRSEYSILYSKILVEHEDLERLVQ